MSSPYEELRALVEVDGEKNEIACGKFLVHALGLLLGKIPIEVINVAQEDRNFFGSSDFVVSARFKGDTGGEERAAYIWEIKAAQCPLMREDGNRNRYAPTVDLYKAENQLIHYLEEATHNLAFKDRFGIGATGRVRAGGIIIGTDSRLVANSATQNVDAARQSINIRKMRLYEHEKIRIMTWDRVIDYLTPEIGTERTP